MVHEVLPKTNLLIADVRDTLNANGGNVNNDVTTFFTSAANIWMWSRFKPVRYNSDFTGMEFYVADDNNCGLYIPRYNHPTLVSDNLDGGLNGWSYNLPRGKLYNEPYRLGDFRKYDPHAAQMFVQYTVPSEVNKAQEFHVSIAITQNNYDEDRTYLVPNDLALSDCYFGAHVVGPNANFIKTASNTIGEGFGIVTFDVSGLLTNVTYTVYPFLCTEKIDIQTDQILEKQNAYCSIPYTDIKTFTVDDEPLGVYISDCQCTVEESNVGVYEFTIKNCTTGAEISDCYVTIKNMEGVIYKEILLNNGESIGTVESNTTTFYYSGTIDIPQEIINAGEGLICVTCNHNDVQLSYKPTNSNIWFLQPQVYSRVYRMR